VLKIHSETITHKTDVGGVQLNLADADAVKKAYTGIEKICRGKGWRGTFPGCDRPAHGEGGRIRIDPRQQHRPAVRPGPLFGLGGQLVEVFKDRALGLPPLTTTLARRMMEQTKIYTALKGVRGRDPVDLAALERLLVRFSQLITEQRWIKELDINPLVASPEN
jgi:acetyltransferase